MRLNHIQLCQNKTAPERMTVNSAFLFPCSALCPDTSKSQEPPALYMKLYHTQQHITDTRDLNYGHYIRSYLARLEDPHEISEASRFYSEQQRILEQRQANNNLKACYILCEHKSIEKSV